MRVPVVLMLAVGAVACAAQRTAPPVLTPRPPNEEGDDAPHAPFTASPYASTTLRETRACAPTAGSRPPVGPSTPGMSDVRVTMGSTRSQMVACFTDERARGGLHLRIFFTFQSSGTTSEVALEATTRGMPPLTQDDVECLLRAACTSVIAPFTNPLFTVSYPFRI